MNTNSIRTTEGRWLLIGDDDDERLDSNNLLFIVNQSCKSILVMLLVLLLLLKFLSIVQVVIAAVAKYCQNQYQERFICLRKIVKNTAMKTQMNEQ